MREFKFRDWDREEKIMRYFNLYSLDGGVIEDGHTIDDESVMQYTGLKDKNGKEIYEGDIVNSPDFKNAMIVKYDMLTGGDDMSAPGIGFQFNDFPEDMQVIGNIYENPELMEKK